MLLLVTGGASGLGAAFVEAYSQQKDISILSLDIWPSQHRRPNVVHYIVDVTSDVSIQRFLEQIGHQPIDLVIHSAGIRGLVSAEEDKRPDNVEACETLEVMNANTLEQTFRINAIGTFMLLQAILPNLRHAIKPKVIVMSSRMGSIGNNEIGKRAAGGAYAYRASKAAVNAMVRSLAVDEPSVTFVLCHPGRVETGLVRCREDGAISAQESVQGLLPLIASWDTTHSGKFFDRFGEPIEW